MGLSVEIEPPQGAFLKIDEQDNPIYQEVVNYVDFVDMISITNRPVFGLSPLTLASQVQKLVNSITQRDIRVNLHLTTRLSHFDTFKTVLDAERVGLSDLLPILGDPRGPKNPSYFKNGFDILGFVSYLKTGNQATLTERYEEMVDTGALVGPIRDASFNVGTVVDVNPTKLLPNGKTIDIRDRQIRFAQKKERLGAEYLISQAIYDPDYYFDFLEQADLDIPILAGIMPARLKLIKTFGLPISDLRKQNLRAQFTTEEEKQIGNGIAAEVYQDLIERGCEYIHVYSIGNSTNFSDITGVEFDSSKIGRKKGEQVQKYHK